jgi:hypothetical protein
MMSRKKTIRSKTRRATSPVRRTRLKVSAREVASESGFNMDTVVLIAFIILSLALKSVKACALSWRRLVMSSSESQLWSCAANEC